MSGKWDLRELAIHFDFSEFDKPPKKSARIVEYGNYMDLDNKIHELTGVYIEGLVEMLAAGWTLVPPKKPKKISEVMEAKDDDR